MTLNNAPGLPQATAASGGVDDPNLLVIPAGAVHQAIYATKQRYRQHSAPAQRLILVSPVLPPWRHKCRQRWRAPGQLLQDVAIDTAATLVPTEWLADLTKGSPREAVSLGHLTLVSKHRFQRMGNCGHGRSPGSQCWSVIMVQVAANGPLTAET